MEPQRKYDCKNYSDCLSLCAKNDIKHMLCGICTQYQKIEIRVTYSDILGCGALVMLLQEDIPEELKACIEKVYMHQSNCFKHSAYDSFVDKIADMDCFVSNEVKNTVGLSEKQVNMYLRQLVANGMFDRQRKGKIFVYKRREKNECKMPNL